MSRLSNFVDILIKLFTLHVQSYLRDTIDFLNYLPKTTWKYDISLLWRAK